MALPIGNGLEDCDIWTVSLGIVTIEHAKTCEAIETTQQSSVDVIPF